jgi:hypothetical protein
MCLMCWSITVLGLTAMSEVVYTETWIRILSGLLTYVGLIVSLFKFHKLQ